MMIHLAIKYETQDGDIVEETMERGRAAKPC